MVMGWSFGTTQYFTTQTRVAFALCECYSPHKQLLNVLLLEFYFCCCLGFDSHVRDLFLPIPELHVDVTCCLFSHWE